MKTWALTHLTRAWTAIFTLVGLGTAFVYKPELVTLYLRTSMKVIETGTAALPYPWGDRVEVILKGIGVGLDAVRICNRHCSRHRVADREGGRYFVRYRRREPISRRSIRVAR
jgi:hypothetical protein